MAKNKYRINVKNPSSIDGVACSGGVDSMVLVDFLLRGGHKPVLYHFNHGTENADRYESFVKTYAAMHGLKFICGHISGDVPKGRSAEDFWREERYKFLHGFSGKIATAHHLDDQAETYLFGCLQGRPRLIRECFKNIYRPMLLTSKESILNWAKKYDVPFIQDQTNFDVSYSRNRIRHKVMPEVLKVNPGFLKVVRRITNEAEK